MKNHPNNSNGKRIRSKKSIVLRIIFIILYSIVLLYLYSIFLDLGMHPLIILLILTFLILIVIGPLMTGISKDLYHKLFQKIDKTKQKSDYQIYKDELKYEQPIIPDKSKNEISLDFRYKKSIIRKCRNCGIIIPNFVKKCPNCGKPILY
jgi:hypothetical protein